MVTDSISIVRRSSSRPVYSTILRGLSATPTTCCYSKHHNPNPNPNPMKNNNKIVSRKIQRQPQQPKANKHLLKARDAVKQLSSISPTSPSPAQTPISLSPNQAIGLVAAAQANFMRVIVPSSNKNNDDNDNNKDDNRDNNLVGAGVELLCVVRALLKKIKRRVCVGDKVLVGSIDWADGRGMIEKVFARASQILDPPVANVDHLMVFFSLDQPKLDPFALTRFLVEAESTGIPLTLVLNKMELVHQQTLIVWKSRLRRWGYEPVFCSVETKHGLDTLQFILREKTSVVLGPSGVGKSSLINALRSCQPRTSFAEREDWLDPIQGSKWFDNQRVGEVSTRSGKGKHTTRHVSLLPLSGGGYLADTPGFNQPSLMNVTKQSLSQHFPEVQKMLKDSEPHKCLFNDCLHLGERGCIVKGDWERFPLYLQLHDEIKIREEYQLRTFGSKREGDVRYKVGDMGVKQAEPRLEIKKHRRQSRKKMNQSIMNELDLDDDDDSIVRYTRDEQ